LYLKSYRCQLWIRRSQMPFYWQREEEPVKQIFVTVKSIIDTDNSYPSIVDTQIITSLALSTPLHGKVSCEQIYYNRLYNTLKFSTLFIVVVGVILLHLQM
jgi:hypothetical protein